MVTPELNMIFPGKIDEALFPMRENLGKRDYDPTSESNGIVLNSGAKRLMLLSDD